MVRRVASHRRHPATVTTVDRQGRTSQPRGLQLLPDGKHFLYMAGAPEPLAAGRPDVRGAGGRSSAHPSATEIAREALERTFYPSPGPPVRGTKGRCWPSRFDGDRSASWRRPRQLAGGSTTSAPPATPRSPRRKAASAHLLRRRRLATARLARPPRKGARTLSNGQHSPTSPGSRRRTRGPTNDRSRLGTPTSGSTTSSATCHALHRGPQRRDDPVWSPDGRRIMFGSDSAAPASTRPPTSSSRALTGRDRRTSSSSEPGSKPGGLVSGRAVVRVRGRPAGLQQRHLDSPAHAERDAEALPADALRRVGSTLLARRRVDGLRVGRIGHRRGLRGPVHGRGRADARVNGWGWRASMAPTAGNCSTSRLTGEPSWPCRSRSGPRRVRAARRPCSRSPPTWGFVPVPGTWASTPRPTASGSCSARQGARVRSAHHRRPELDGAAASLVARPRGLSRSSSSSRPPSASGSARAGTRA